MAYVLKINGKLHTVDADGDTPLLWVLRDLLQMTGTKFGCGMALCGACTVHLEGAPTRACITPIHSVSDRQRYQRCDVGQCLPLRRLQSHPRRDQARCGGSKAMTPTAAEREDVPALSRRTFLKTGVTAAGGLALTFAMPSWSGAAGAHQGNALNGFVRIDPDGRVHLTIPMVEMGQGIYTSLAMLLAEELEVKLQTVVLEHAPPNDELYANPILHEQSTGLSASMRGFWLPLRQAGAAARMMLVAAAAQRWKVDPATCTVREGVIFDRSGKRSLLYRDVMRVAARITPPAIDQIRLKPSQEFTLIGTSTKRLEAAGKVRGLTQFGIDVIVPGMKIAAIAISPVGGGKPKQVNKTAALAVKGVRQVVMIDEAVAVVAVHTGAAKKGLEAAAIQWDDRPNAAVSSASLLAQLKAVRRVRARSRGMRAISRKPLPRPASASTPFTNCRSWRMRRWS